MKKLKYQFLLGPGYTIIIMGYLFIMIKILLFFLFVDGKIVPPQGASHLQSQLVLWPLVFKVSASLMLIPFLRNSYSIMITPDSLGGVNKPFPFLNIRRHVSWHHIYRVSYSQFLLTTFYVLYNERGQILCWIPIDVGTNKKLLQALNEAAPTSPFTSFVSHEKKDYFLNVFPFISNTSRAFSIYGKIVQNNKKSDRALVHRKVNIIYQGVIISQFQTNSQEEFHHSFTHFTGVYSLEINDKNFVGSVTVKLPRPSKNSIILLVERR